MKDQTGKKIWLLMWCILCISTHAVSASVIRIDSKSAAPGETVTFTVSAADVTDAVQALGFEVVYDATVLQFRGFSPGSLTQKFTHFSASNTDFGTVRIGGFDAGENTIQQGASGVLLRMDFEVAEGKDCALQIRNLLDDVKGWSAGDGSFYGIADEEADDGKDDGEKDTDGTVKEPENPETGESVSSEEGIPLSADTLNNMENNAVPSPDFRTASEPADEKIGKVVPGSNKSGNMTEEKAVPKEESGSAKTYKGQTVPMPDSKNSVPLQKNQADEKETGIRNLPQSVRLPNSPKNDGAADTESGNPGIGIWHWSVLIVLTLILAVLLGIFWQIMEIKRI